MFRNNAEQIPDLNSSDLDHIEYLDLALPVSLRKPRRCVRKDTFDDDITSAQEYMEIKPDKYLPPSGLIRFNLFSSPVQSDANFAASDLFDQLNEATANGDLIGIDGVLDDIEAKEKAYLEGKQENTGEWDVDFSNISEAENINGQQKIAPVEQNLEEESPLPVAIRTNTENVMSQQPAAQIQASKSQSGTSIDAASDASEIIDDQELATEIRTQISSIIESILDMREKYIRELLCLRYIVGNTPFDCDKITTFLAFHRGGESETQSQVSQEIKQGEEEFRKLEEARQSGRIEQLSQSLKVICASLGDDRQDVVGNIAFELTKSGNPMACLDEILKNDKANYLELMESGKARCLFPTFFEHAVDTYQHPTDVHKIKTFQKITMTAIVEPMRKIDSEEGLLSRITRGLYAIGRAIKRFFLSEKSPIKDEEINEKKKLPDRHELQIERMKGYLLWSQNRQQAKRNANDPKRQERENFTWAHASK